MPTSAGLRRQEAASKQKIQNRNTRKHTQNIVLAQKYNAFFLRHIRCQ